MTPLPVFSCFRCRSTFQPRPVRLDVPPSGPKIEATVAPGMVLELPGFARRYQVVPREELAANGDLIG